MSLYIFIYKELSNKQIDKWEANWGWGDWWSEMDTGKGISVEMLYASNSIIK